MFKLALTKFLIIFTLTIGGSTSSLQAFSEQATDAISIKGQAYVGVRGLLKTWRDNIWIRTETISTYDDSDILPGHGFDSNKDLWLQAGSVNVPFTIVKAGQWLNMWTVYNAINSEFYIKTYGSHIQAGNSLCINTVNWAGDSRLETEGGILSVPSIEFGRTFNYFGKSICFSTKKVRDDLTRGPDIYGHFINFYEKDVAYPPLTKDQLFLRWYHSLPSNSGGDGGGGGGGMSLEKFSGSYNSRHQRMTPVTITGFDLAFSYRNGTSNIGGSIDLTSGFGSTTTLGFGYSHSNSDRLLNLYSSYNATTFLEQVRQGVHGISHITMDPNLALHKFSSAAILQMTAPTQMNIDVNRGIWIAQSLYALDKLCQVGASQIVQGIITLGKVANDVVEKGQQKAKEMQSGSKAMTGGQLPDPDDEDPKKRKYEDAKYHHSQSSGAKSKAPNKGQEALDNSVPYGNKGDRVAVDKESNEFIVLMKDGPNSYHGHVRTWDGLTEGMKKALSENNLVRLLSSGSKAKIL